MLYVANIKVNTHWALAIQVRIVYADKLRRAWIIADRG